MSSPEIEKHYTQAANLIVRAGMVPFAVTETLLEIIKYYLDREDAEFIISGFAAGSSQSHEQMKEKTGMSDGEIRRLVDKLAKKGIIFNQPNSKGVMVYRLLPLIVVGAFEYTFMRELPRGEELKKYEKIAKLYKKLMEELRDNIQRGYDALLPVYDHQPPVDRTVPVFTTEGGAPIKIALNEQVTAEERIVPAQTVQEIIDKYEEIAVGHCFCRNYTRVLDHDCEINAPSEVCFTFGKSARHTVAQGFARPVSREEAMKIMVRAEEAGLVHKAFHNGSNIQKEENSICNCCKDCCDTFTLWRNGAAPMINATNYLSLIDKEGCTGCGICVERCPVDAISLDGDEKAERVESYCIGCGICARFCPTQTISLKEGMRRVCVPPPRLR